MKDSTTPNTPRPRILPTAPGWWWVLFLGDPTPRAAYVERVAVPEILDLGPSVLMAGLVGHQTQTSVERDEFTWLARIPTPEQLAAQAAQLAAGQALADWMRIAYPCVTAPYVNEGGKLGKAFLAAFPAGGAR